MVIMQGDQYSIPIEISLANGAAKPSDFADVEIIIAGIRKTMSKGEIGYDVDEAVFLFPIEQKETFMLNKRNITAQARVKLHNGDVVGRDLGDIEFIESSSRTVI